jgi:hypothetical protein
MIFLPPLRDRSRVVPRSDSVENAGFPISRRVIGEHVSHPLLGSERVTRTAGAAEGIAVA